jgi:hypothetical protein
VRWIESRITDSRRRATQDIPSVPLLTMCDGSTAASAVARITGEAVLEDAAVLVFMERSFPSATSLFPKTCSHEVKLEDALRHAGFGGWLESLVATCGCGRREAPEHSWRASDSRAPMDAKLDLKVECA